jgi:hypothetical protein
LILLHAGGKPVFYALRNGCHDEMRSARRSRGRVAVARV